MRAFLAVAAVQAKASVTEITRIAHRLGEAARNASCGLWPMLTGAT